MAKPEERILTHISNLRPVKRITDVIRVFHKVLSKIPAKLIIVGDGPEKEIAETLCKKLDIKAQVLFLGNSSEIDKILCFSDLFLLPSEKESFGLAALEAMACGVPVISSNAGGLPEVNTHGITGFLSDVGDVETMAKYALEILKNNQSLTTFKAQAKQAAKTFDTSKIVPLYEAIYKRAYASTTV